MSVGNSDFTETVLLTLFISIHCCYNFVLLYVGLYIYVTAIIRTLFLLRIPKLSPSLSILKFFRFRVSDYSPRGHLKTLYVGSIRKLQNSPRYQ